MNQSVIPENEFDKLLHLVEILRGHFSKIYSKSERELIRLRRARDREGFDALKAVRAEMRREYDEALDLIAEKLITPEQLMKTRKKLREAADKAYKFLKDIKEINAGLEDFKKAAEFLSKLVGDLRVFL
ncbi:hypothetical protein NNA36_08825 [Shimia sp. CNT1-13L.2]|uniref:hypothetical protein n=1 Tax=Shimia sp. CNT1-13L.2 TaxID=2959663 RepID=UPI0020CBFBC0|nr:hypothetical protein [Shimia sp. CNT1-13L.2]MCP9482061.1 hypothetical protein [Shimia sp. CNT1-13L.2]